MLADRRSFQPHVFFSKPPVLFFPALALGFSPSPLPHRLLRATTPAASAASLASRRLRLPPRPPAASARLLGLRRLRPPPPASSASAASACALGIWELVEGSFFC
ncbi:hypothetical protein GUJ93_ZPchr0003g18108 [Zizania palustris]|uniref:Uncharacterized protein n=1 Tax=Zizania palustris TaxID=103762 RepID=A0A8J5S0W6_ZIZPA|nr:hypothetical protein GUJ93_ZPchr0003g18108 [Zizania palustris]